MYLKHYNLALKPFEISPDPKFLWLGEKHEEALAAVKYGILDNKGFISLTGDAGTGKTTIVNALANSLGDNIIFAQIPDPALKQLDFLNLTADALKMNKKFSTKGDFLIHLRHFLNKAYVHHKEVVLVIEEAHRFNPERLEEVRLLSNIDKPDKKLINIVFVGQNEFNSLLKENKALRQRIAISHNINPLHEIETGQYVMHRLKIAGSDKEIFTPAAVREIYSFSKGNPRLINIICDSALLTGYAGEKKIIEPEIIKECAANFLLPKQQKENTIKDLSASSKSIPETVTGIQPGTSENAYQKADQKVRIKPAGRKLSYVIPMFVVFLLSIFGYLYFFGENHALYRNLKTFLGPAFDHHTGSKSETSSQKPDETTKRQSNIAGTKVQALDLKTQKTSIDTQLVQLKSRNEELTAALEELKGAKERVAALEGVAIGREQTLFQSEQKVSVLTNALDREKKSQDLLRAELSTKAAQVAEFQQKLEAALSSRAELANDVEKNKNEIAELEGQLLDLKAQKTFSDTQLVQLKSRTEKLTADLEELKGMKERVAELEGVAAGREKTLSHLELKVSDLTSALDQEKKSQDLLRAELSTKAAQVAEFQQKLEAALSSRAELANDVEKSKNTIAELEGQLLDLKAQKTSSDTQLVRLKSRNESLTADLEELKGAKERVAEFEGQAAMHEQTLTQSEQKVTDLTNALNREKKSRGLLRAALLTKVDLVAELQQKLQISQTNQKELEQTINKNKKEIAELQEQLRELKAQQAPTETSPIIVDVKKKSISKSEGSGEQGNSPSPSDVIDRVLQKKAK